MEKSICSQEYGVFLRMLRDARRDAGITQATLGKRLGCTQSFISKCERGERRLDVIEVRRFCDALGLDFPQFTARIHAALGAKGRKLRC